MKNKNMKKWAIVLLLFIFQATPAFAIDLGFEKRVQGAASKAGYGSAIETTLAETAGIAIKAALSFVGVIFLVLMVYAGYLWFTSRGEEEPIKKAQKIIMASVIGLVIVAGAYGITSLIVPRILKRPLARVAGADSRRAKVSCCSICPTWTMEPTCPKQKLSEKECAATEDGVYLGLKPSEECK